MAYTIYETKAVILGVRPIQEHDLFLRVFSDVFGYINIVAKGTRKAGSKLRPHINEYSIATLSVVKGKEMFRLTDARRVFAFDQSRSVVSFFRQAEKLFYHHEEDHGLETNIHIYKMFGRLAKLLVFIVNEELTIVPRDVQDFFTVFVLGEQGFVTKLDWEEGKRVEDFLKLGDVEVCVWLEKNKSIVQDLLKKNSERVV
ncbi:MAG: hypothetical protein RJB39_236 [Candidatus Parcubacteria bacterium]|jgi:hypothetical protein